MDKRAFVTFIPIQLDDIIQPKGQTKEYKVIDILTTYSCKLNDVFEVKLSLIDVKTEENCIIDFNDFEWTILKEA